MIFEVFTSEVGRIEDSMGWIAKNNEEIKIGWGYQGRA